jgi:serine/threonine protein kinase/Tol biopolymer transport system component
MATARGTRIGPYEVGTLIGQGGMGEVYRGRDTRLGRDVALKVLPDAFARTPERLARFRNEAHVLASLNHPNIAHIYGLEESNGTHALVMELVDGATLAARIATGPIAIDEALAIARQMSEGLEAAHEQGVIHRDLKPSNVMVRNDGTVKVLDFGLATAFAAVEQSSDPSNSPTVTSPAMTQQGVILGTAAYMSPEQARGKRVDKRADIWAFGCVLYEMLTGRRPFAGDTVPDLLVAVMSREPDWDAVAAVAPARIVHLLRLCLEKDPRHRLRDIGDARLELEEPRAGETLATHVSWRARNGWRLVAAAGALAVLVAIGWAWATIEREPANVVWRSRPVVTSSNDESDSRISPDGRWISFLSSAGVTTQLLVQRTDGGAAQPVTVPAGRLVSQLWSPGGDQLAYVLRHGESTSIQVVPAFFGGVPSRSIALDPAPSDARLLRWIDQVIYLQVAHGPSLLRLDLTSGTATNVSEGWRIGAAARAFDVRPDGGKVVFTALTDGQEDLWIADLDGSSAERLTNDPSFEHHPLWSGDGASVIFQSNRGGQTDLWQVTLASRRFERVTSSETVEEPESTTPDGAVVSYRHLSRNANLLAWDAAGKVIRQLTDDALSDLAPTSSATGGVVAFQRSRPSPLLRNPLANSVLFVGVVDGSRFTSEPTAVADGFAARLSPDGSRLAYLQGGSDPQHASLVVKHLRTGDTVTLSTTCPMPAYSQAPIEWAHQNLAWDTSGTALYFVDRPDAFTVRRYQVNASAPEAPLVRAGAREEIHDLHVSGNGLLAYLVSSPAASTLHIRHLETGEQRSAATLEGRASARGWLRDDAGVVLARASAFDEDFTAEVEVLVASATGTVRSAGVVDRTFIATTRLDPQRAVVSLTRLDAGIQNLYEFPLATGRLRRLTDNTLPGVSYSGVTPLGGGAWVAVRHEQRSDIWLLDARPQAPNPGDSSGR